MELSERFIAQLEKEGFETITECQMAPGVVFPVRAHSSMVAFCITDGSISFNFSGKQTIVLAPERCNVPAGVSCTATVGTTGVIYVIGEDILIPEA